jgi:hypothetical protein
MLAEISCARPLAAHAIASTSAQTHRRIVFTGADDIIDAPQFRFSETDMENEQAHPSLGRFSSQRPCHDSNVKFKDSRPGREHARKKLARGYEQLSRQAIIEKN